MNLYEPQEFTLLKEKPFTASDRMLIAHLREDWGETNSWILLAAALCNLAVREGHAFFDLGQTKVGSFSLPKAWPALSQWTEMLAASHIVRSEEDDNPACPLVFCPDSALYLEKYYSYEKCLSELLRKRCGQSVETDSSDPVERAANRSFFVITGGPGTGKTTLALRYLDTLLDSWRDSRPARFAAVAPTGKAAARLAESISTGVARMSVSEKRKQELLAIPCLTIHRLLGSLPHRSTFRKNARKPLRFDTLVIDESSMIDLPLMLKLFQSLPDSCQVLLLGDKDQLTSVDVGSVLNDILEAADSDKSVLSHSVERLTKTYRFSEDSGIFKACEMARTGDVDGFLEVLQSRCDDIEFHALSKEAKRLPLRAIARAVEQNEPLRNAPSPMKALEILNTSITLTPTRSGAFGSVEFNRRVEAAIRKARGLDPLSPAPLHGAPLIVLENNYELELYNGDLGLTWIDSETGAGYAIFSGADGSARRFRLSELPRHESAFALTIHKSQGSEFAETVCFFGPGAERSLTRELVYTALSRAKERLLIYGDPDSLGEAIARRAFRATRLSELLKVR